MAQCAANGPLYHSATWRLLSCSPLSSSSAAQQLSPLPLPPQASAAPVSAAPSPPASAGSQRAAARAPGWPPPDDGAAPSLLWSFGLDGQQSQSTLEWLFFIIIMFNQISFGLIDDSWDGSSSPTTMSAGETLIENGWVDGWIDREQRTRQRIFQKESGSR